MTALLLIGVFLLVLSGMAVVDWWMGPDSDLEDLR